MKLLSKITIYYIVFSLITFIIGGVLFYKIIKTIIYRQLDENLITEKNIIEQQINHSDSLPDFRTVFGHLIQVTVFNRPMKKQILISDTLTYDYENSEFVTFRHLSATNKTYNSKGYELNIYKSASNSKLLIIDIFIAIFILFISLLIILLLINFRVSKKALVPFYKTLVNISNYDINKDIPLTLAKTNITEFNQLNKVLQKMSNKIRKDYLNLKEFNENASHEVQTPLAIIKSKLDLLIQNESLSIEHLNLIKSVYDATNRIAKLNQGLLLISKIENLQFSDTESIDLQDLIDKIHKNFEELIDLKNITIIKKYKAPVLLNLNPVLAEILISNLLNNAIKHNFQQGLINILLNSNELIISNTGLPLEINPKILFERFKKVKSSSDSVGLGLAIVKKIVNLYQMRVVYEFNNNLHTLKIIFQ